MKLTRLVVSDLHLANDQKPGEPNPMEDFFHDERFTELLEHYDREHGQTGGVELILNLEVLNPLKDLRSHIDRIQPLSRFFWGSLVFDPRIALTFCRAASRSRTASCWSTPARG